MESQVQLDRKETKVQSYDGNAKIFKYLIGAQQTARAFTCVSVGECVCVCV